MKKNSGKHPITKHLYPIPSVISPVGYRCITVQIPDSDEYARLFRGAIATLESWYNYERTGNNEGSQTATVWRDALREIDLMGNCAMIEYRMKPDNCGIIQYSLDGGETWIDMPDLNECFVALNPASTARNRVLPTTTTVTPLTLKGLTSHSADMFAIENSLDAKVFRVLPEGSTELKGYLKAGDSQAFLWSRSQFASGDFELDLFGHGGNSLLRYWSSFSGQLLWLFESAYFDATRFYIYANGQKTRGLTLRDDGKLGMATDSPNARLHVKNALAGERGVIVQLAAAPSLNAFEVIKSDGALYSGFDKRGELFVVSYPGIPIHTPDQNFTIVGNAGDSSLWWFDGGSWNRAWMAADGDVISEVNYSDAAPGESGSATLENGVLDIEFPAPTTADNMPRIYHSARSRPAPGESDSVIIAMDANGAQALPWTTAEGDVITISEITGWMNDGSAVTSPNEGYRGDGTWYYSGDPAPNVLGYVSENVPPMSILLLYNTDGDTELIIETPDLLTGATLSTVNEEKPYALFIPNYTLVPNNRYGNVQFKVTLTPNALEFIATQGNVIEQSGGYIKVEATFTGGAVNAYRVIVDAATCFEVTAIDSPGTTFSLERWAECVSGGTHDESPIGHCATSAQWRSLDPFTIEIWGIECDGA